jgi:hypothetical protein
MDFIPSQLPGRNTAKPRCERTVGRRLPPRVRIWDCRRVLLVLVGAAFGLVVGGCASGKGGNLLTEFLNAGGTEQTPEDVARAAKEQADRLTAMLPKTGAPGATPAAGPRPDDAEIHWIDPAAVGGNRPNAGTNSSTTGNPAGSAANVKPDDPGVHPTRIAKPAPVLDSASDDGGGDGASRPVPGAEPIGIRTVQLCKRVRGYGVYDPLDGRALLAGRENKMVVYVEVDHFKTVKNSQGQFEVKLGQSMSLYNEADGLEVWRKPEVEITDESRNARRDFFVVQLIALPANLSVGKYLLKIRIADRHAGCLDEMSVPVRVVADDALVSGAK